MAYKIIRLTNLQICWYVHSDQSSRSVRVGHFSIWINKFVQDVSVGNNKLGYSEYL